MLLVVSHIFGDWRLDGDGDDSRKDAAVEGGGKLSGLVRSEHQGHSVARLHHLPSSQLVQHVGCHSLRSVSELTYKKYVNHINIRVLHDTLALDLTADMPTYSRNNAVIDSSTSSVW